MSSFRKKPAQERRDNAAGSALDRAGLFANFADIVSFDEAAALLIIPAVILAIVGELLLAGAMPMLLMDGVAGLLAEVAVQFVFGALIARRVILPKAHDAAFMTIVARTCLAGLALVVASAGAGWLLARLDPGGTTIADLFR